MLRKQRSQLADIQPRTPGYFNSRDILAFIRREEKLGRRCCFRKLRGGGLVGEVRLTEHLEGKAQNEEPESSLLCPMQDTPFWTYIRMSGY